MLAVDHTIIEAYHARMVDQVIAPVRPMNDRQLQPLSGESETVQSVDRALAIVELLLRSGETLTVREVALGTLLMALRCAPGPTRMAPMPPSGSSDDVR